MRLGSSGARGTREERWNQKVWSLKAGSLVRLLEGISWFVSWFVSCVLKNKWIQMMLHQFSWCFITFHTQIPQSPLNLKVFWAGVIASIAASQSVFLDTLCRHVSWMMKPSKLKVDVCEGLSRSPTKNSWREKNLETVTDQIHTKITSKS